MECILLYTNTFKKWDKLIDSNFLTYSLKIAGRFHRANNKQLQLMKDWDRKKHYSLEYIFVLYVIMKHEYITSSKN